ncbi:MAG: type II toxin-antitoxin system RelE/ParE family toxin [Gammaproteobacteria bacterium]|jgi:toxin ParE1/3/4|nr:type II toxin-antitoxin system RelE/ParE family toxin [Gammaproteobacteria bacterium]MBT3725847.1 type II toxin-antitoxin system RelE/ParE family toxin [Gammaproteobacteria bacterium]MBT4195726.1 type II toxin-antitoxin system RelE/ParE family toxin [Gammaproteobacteria bacterium]MBT4450803.1 type II toxin-antitoxin system RelE/ParE family toxin [Gammaproteobacteria bacterium]MBT4860507.1 type II toxin-antitoxin system RelE/ParE family toxin [Gammaproteobacteria bacterium]
MANKYRIRSLAESDLESIWLYTVEQWSVDQADTYLKSIIQRLDWLADNPFLGKQRDDVKKGYYCFPEGMHLVFYKIIDNQIEIIGIPHQSMDIIECLKEE